MPEKGYLNDPLVIFAGRQFTRLMTLSRLNSLNVLDTTNIGNLRQAITIGEMTAANLLSHSIYVQKNAVLKHQITIYMNAAEQETLDILS